MRRRCPAVLALALLSGLACASARGQGAASPSLPAWLSSIAGSLTITADAIEWQGLRLSALTLPAALDGGRLTVADGRFELAGGAVAFTLVHDPFRETTLNASGNDLRPGRLPGLESYVEGLPLTVSVSLRGRGSSLQTVARSAAGTFRARNSSGGRLLRAGTQSAGNALLSLFSAALPFAEDASALAVECVALDWTFADGRAQTPLGVELLSRRIRVTGGGEIDLAAQALRIDVRPRARAGFDPAGLAIASAIRIEGSFADPVVRVDSGALIGKAAAYGGKAVATLSGARLLGVVREEDAGPSLCTSAP